MRTALTVSLVLFLLTYTPRVECQDNPSEELFSPEQLDNLLAPIALYPDPLLAQVLLAATFPDQIDEAARFLRANADPNYIDSQPWDVSVKAIAHYPTVLYMMADKLDWTTAVGQVYVNQSTDVMTSVQRLRAEARAAGNLDTTPQEQIVDTDGYIEIWPAQPQVIYVPMYDPALVYFGSGGRFRGSLISFGVGFAIGAWLNHDCDWRGHRVFYHGWEGGGGWIGRSRPYVRVTNVYVNNNYRNVQINRTVVNRQVNYNNLNRYNSVHREVNYNNVRVNAPIVNIGRPVVNNNVNVSNKILQRNMNVDDPRVEVLRGRGADRQPMNPPQAVQPQVNGPAMNQPEVARPQINPQEMNRPTNTPLPRQAERPNNSAFGGNQSVFGARAASERGQASREQMSRPAPSPPPRPSNPPQSHEDKGGRR